MYIGPKANDLHMSKYIYFINMTQQVDVAISSKEMCVEVTDKSGLPIAGFLRNIYQYSLYYNLFIINKFILTGTALNLFWGI